MATYMPNSLNKPTHKKLDVIKLVFFLAFIFVWEKYTTNSYIKCFRQYFFFLKSVSVPNKEDSLILPFAKLQLEVEFCLSEDDIY